MGIGGGGLAEGTALEQLKLELATWGGLIDEEISRLETLRGQSKPENLQQDFLEGMNRVSAFTRRLGSLVAQVPIEDLIREESPACLDYIVGKLTKWASQLIQLIRQHTQGLNVQSFSVGADLGLSLGANVSITFGP